MSIYDNLTGRTYGKLTVVSLAHIRKSHRFYTCLCACGRVTTVNAAKLVHIVRSCKACASKDRGRDFTGVRVGRLVVLGKDVASYPDGFARWRCQCDCGNVTLVASSNLLKGTNAHTKSCGCLQIASRSMRRYTKLALGEAGLTTLIYNYRNGARARGLPFELTREVVRALTSQPCFYCGVEPRQISIGRTMKNTLRDAAFVAHTTYVYNGIDRKDNTVGYTVDNCVPCCTPCNLFLGSRAFTDKLKAIRGLQILRADGYWDTWKGPSQK